MAGEEVPWPPPPREVGPWNGGPPLSPPGNTPLPPLPGSGGVVHGTAAQSNPWANPGGSPESLTGPNRAPQGGFAPSDGQRMDPFPGLPPGPGRVDRAPAWVLVASAIIVVAVVAGAAFVLVKGGRQYPSEWDARVAPITTWVSKERELEFEHPVKVNFLSDKEYTARATEGGDDDSVESDQFYADQVAQLRALGFVTGDVDLAKANDTLSDSGTLAYYDPDVEQVFVRGTELTPALRVTLAHELTHVLQDQNFDLERLEDLSSGQASVLRALAEGDATKVEDAYIETLDDADAKAYEEESKSSGDEATEDLDENVPPILTTIFSSPYVLGPRLVDALDASGGWDAIDEALEEPPTEEAMFDPITYKTDAAAQKTVSIEAPEGTEPIESDEFGPTTWFLLLASRIDPKVALAATDGWGGDQYVVYREDDKVCLNATIEGDTPEDEKQMADALTAWAAKSPTGTAEVTNEDEAVQFHSCDPGKDAKAVGKEVTPEVLALPVTRTDIYTQAIAGDRTPKESACFANGVVDAFTAAQLQDPEGAFVSSDEGQRILTGIRSTCFG
ncbi:hypothetical protein ACE2AJ_10410 [Aquihabitans daechungensis]|uniref:hypothetical protein n=1 Tax=Aquihabitans daechungensis TaxID=1052257 RepID=UPI003B9FE5FE